MNDNIINLFQSIQNKVNTIQDNVQAIIDVILRHDPFNTDVFDISNFNKVAKAIDDVISKKGQSVFYLSNYECQENEVMLQVALYPTIVSPKIQMKIKGEYYLVINGSTSVGNSNGNNLLSFSLPNYDDMSLYEVLQNEEGWKPVNIKIKAVEPIETLQISSNCPIISFSSNLPSYMGRYGDILNLSNVRTVNMKNVRDANSLFANCSKLMKANVDVSRAYDLRYMFQNCTSLIELYNLNTTNANVADGIFEGCTSLNYAQFITVPPKNLDLSPLGNGLDRVVKILNAIPKNEGDVITIYTSATLSDAQLQSFITKGYNIVKK